MPEPTTPRRWLLRAAGRALTALGSLPVFATAAAAGLYLHLDAPAVRRLGAHALASALTDTFAGTVEVRELDELGLRRVRARGVDIRDPHGASVLRASVLLVRADAVEIARSWLFGDGPRDVRIPFVRAENVETELIEDPATGEPTIALAFQPRPRPAAAGPAAPPSRPVRVLLDHVELERVWSRSQLGGLPVLETTVARVTGTVGVTPERVLVNVRRFGGVVRGLAGADLAGTGAVHLVVPGKIEVAFSGHLGQLQAEARVAVRGSKLEAHVEIPEARPEVVRALWADWPVLQTVTGEASVSGELPELSVETRLTVGDRSRIAARGTARLGAEPRLALSIEGRRVDLRAALADAPDTSLDSDLSLELLPQPRGVWASVNGELSPSRIEGLELPRADYNGVLDERGFTGKVKLHESGMPVGATVRVAPSGIIELDVSVKPFAIGRAPRVARLTPARGVAGAELRGKIEAGRLNARVAGAVAQLRYGDVRLGQAEVTGSASGPVSQPERLAVDLRLAARRVSAAGFAFDRVQARARGPVRSPFLTASLGQAGGLGLSVSGRVRTEPAPSVSDLRLRAARGDDAIEGRVARVEVRRGRVDVRGIDLAGAGGTLRGELGLREGVIEASVEARHVDLGAVGRLLSLERLRLAGTADLTGELVSSDEVQRGHLRVEVKDGGAWIARGAAATATVNLRGDDLTGELAGSLPGWGAVTANFTGILPGFVDDPAAWRELTGSLKAGVSMVPLDDLSLLLARSGYTVGRGGFASAELRIERLRAYELPSISVKAQTLGLVVGREGDSGEPWLSGRELEVGVSADGPSRRAQALVQLDEWRDAEGRRCGRPRSDCRRATELVASAGAELGLEELLDRPEALLARLLERPVSGVVTLPETELARLEPLLPGLPFAARASGEIRVDGTLKAPRVVAKLRARDLAWKAPKAVRPLALDATLGYSRADEQVTGEIVLRDGAARLVARPAIHLPWASVEAALRGDEPAVWGATRFEAHALPLDALPWLARSRVSATATGHLTIERTQDGRARTLGSLDLAGLAVDGRRLGRASLQARDFRGDPRVALRIDQERGGRLTVDAFGPVDWSHFVPDLGASGKLGLIVDLEQTEAVVLTPLLEGVLAHPRGRLNGRLAAELRRPRTPLGERGGEWLGYVNGRVELVGGSAQVPQLGLRIEDVSAVATATVHDPERWQLVVHPVKGRARSRARNVQAGARFELRGLRLTEGAVALSGQRIPLLLEGVSLGEATTVAPITVGIGRETTADGERLTAKVTIDGLDVRLPAAASRRLIPLEDHPDVRVVQLEEARRTTRAEREIPWVVRVDLRRARLVHEDALVPVRGEPEFVLGREVDASGWVELEPGGRVALLGKNFTVDYGHVRFDTGEASDPSLSVSASWQAPSGTTVHVDVIGRVSQARLTLRSTPPLDEAEILSLLRGVDPSGAESSSLGAGINAANVGLNELLRGTPFDVVEIRSTTSRTAGGATSENYTAAVRISERVWFEGTYSRAATASGPGANDQSAFSGTIDWRFLRAWSLRTEAGTQGAGVDLLYQYRY
ncbi:MAG: translocation/assembly module TamB domain-containing protein [Polyangiaceae bacterium]|nr:translocation/assembly module TamB domain-containing protein [Polyangiaceae bacterium]